MAALVVWTGNYWVTSGPGLGYLYFPFSTQFLPRRVAALVVCVPASPDLITSTPRTMRKLFLRTLPRAPLVAHVDGWILSWRIPPSLFLPLCRQGTTDTAISPCLSGPGHHRRTATGHPPAAGDSQDAAEYAGSKRPCRAIPGYLSSIAMPSRMLTATVSTLRGADAGAPGPSSGG